MPWITVCWWTMACAASLSPSVSPANEPMVNKPIHPMPPYGGAPAQDLPNLDAISSLCVKALEIGAGSHEAMAAFHSVATPRNLGALVRIAQTALSDMERQELARLIDELTYYVKIVPDEKGLASPLDRDELILRARQVRSVIGI